MESVFGRYRNITILVGVLFLQALGLAVQVKRNTESGPTRLIRVWTVNAVTPFEKAIVGFQNGSAGIWHNYFYLRGVRQENRDLKAEIERLRLAQVRLNEDAEQARRLQILLGFKEQFIAQTMAAQVIGSSGSEQSRSVYIDKGYRDGVRPDMAVITADGIVGKVLRVFGGRPFEASTAEVLLINDQSSGVGVILEKSRLQGILRGSVSGQVVMEKVMADEEVKAGDRVLTSGGDQIFPKGFPVGTVTKVASGSELFLNIQVKPAADLAKLEEVLIITKTEVKEPSTNQAGPVRAVDILAQRLPSVPDKPQLSPPETAKSAEGGVNSKPAQTAGGSATKTQTTSPTPALLKPGATAATAKPAASNPPGVTNNPIKPAPPNLPEPKPEPPPEDTPQ